MGATRADKTSYHDRGRRAGSADGDARAITRRYDRGYRTISHLTPHVALDDLERIKANGGQSLYWLRTSGCPR